MTGSTEDLFAADPSGPVEDFAAAMAGAALVYIKKLALNDWQWTGNRDAHQGGVYIPFADRDSGFFPGLSAKAGRGKQPAINEAWFNVVWPQSGGEIKLARLVNYRSKGEETHLTNVIKEPFTAISPASLLVVARHEAAAAGDPPRFTALVADSAGPAADYLRDLFRLGTEFTSGVFQPAAAERAAEEETLSYVEQAVAAWKSGTLADFARLNIRLPGTVELAALAQQEYLGTHGLSSLDPFAMGSPGDAVMQISRDIEYRLYKDYELRARSMELVAIILGHDSARMSVERALRAIVADFTQIDRVLLSAAQQRKSRAGRSFELHIQRLLEDGRIPHDVQVVIQSRKRPDFVLPSLRMYSNKSRTHEEALVLSAKTTLRERWKQVHGEIRDCDLFLATVDENVASATLDEMAESGIRLVVPESLKDSNVTAYRGHANAISFKTFFEDEVRARRFPLWQLS